MNTTDKDILKTAPLLPHGFLSAMVAVVGAQKMKRILKCYWETQEMLAEIEAKEITTKEEA